MGIPVTNKNTAQTPNYLPGLTGTQSIKFIPAARVYVKSADSVSAAPIQNYWTKSNGVTPVGWTDLGSVDSVKLDYSKTYTDIKLGIDKKVFDSYLSESSMEATFDLDQFDDTVIQQILGLTPSVVVPGSSVSFPIGQETFGPKALLFVVQNKIDGKEHHFYHPAAPIDGTWDDSSDSMVLKVTAKCIAFTAQGDVNSRYIDHFITA